MSNLYIYQENKDTYLSFQENRLIILYGINDKKSIPIEKISNVVIFGYVNMSTPCMQELLKKGVHLTWLSKNGNYFGRLESTSHININRQRLQFRKSDDENFSLEISKQFIMGKVLNEKTILLRANKKLFRNNILSDIIAKITINLKRIKEARSIEELMGVEGFFTKIYYEGLNHIIIDEDFHFAKRTKRPPRDPFNALISFGYTLLHYEIFTILVTKGLNPYAAFLHSDRHKHPALCSDLMEEWRAILVDSLAIALLNTGKIKIEDFDFVEQTGAVFLNKKACKKFTENFEKRLRQEVSYVPEVSYKMSFRRIIEYQVMKLIRAMENNEATIYKSILIR